MLSLFSLSCDYITKQFSVTMASSSRNVLLSEEIDNVLNEQFTDSDNSLFDSDDDCNIVNDLPVKEATALEKTENEDSDSVQEGSYSQHVADVVYLNGRTCKITVFARV
jgi:uncharacterized Zn ribbon protein